jgi:hypothetical protein
MFVTSANDAYALDAKTGKLLWHHARAVTPGLVDDAGQHHNRGVAILGMRLYMETDNAQALWLFSSDACGLYGFDNVRIEHAGRTDPRGNIVLSADDGKIDLYSQSGLLLRVQGS